MKKILITGANSYIGVSFEKWVQKWSDRYYLETLDMQSSLWRKKDFSKFDVIFHVAGISHASCDPKLESLYYKVNRDLSIETAQKAKREGVKQFIFMSSIIVYGDGSRKKKVINSNTVPLPSNYYGDSKLQAEKGIKSLEDENFKVVIIRAPMVYGKGSKGNYPKLVKVAQKLPIFPEMDNERSMIHIDNLCEFIRAIIDNEESGLFFPQNKEYVNTSEMVRLIAEMHGKKIRMTKILNPILNLLFWTKIMKKVFGNLIYDKSMSSYDKMSYQIRDFKESIKLTEK